MATRSKPHTPLAFTQIASMSPVSSTLMRFSRKAPRERLKPWSVVQA